MHTHASIKMSTHIHMCVHTHTSMCIHTIKYYMHVYNMHICIYIYMYKAF